MKLTQKMKPTDQSQHRQFDKETMKWTINLVTRSFSILTHTSISKVVSLRRAKLSRDTWKIDAFSKSYNLMTLLIRRNHKAFFQWDWQCSYGQHWEVSEHTTGALFGTNWEIGNSFKQNDTTDHTARGKITFLAEKISNRRIQLAGQILPFNLFDGYVLTSKDSANKPIQLMIWRM